MSKRNLNVTNVNTRNFNYHTLSRDGIRGGMEWITMPERSWGYAGNRQPLTSPAPGFDISGSRYGALYVEPHNSTYHTESSGNFLVFVDNSGYAHNLSINGGGSGSGVHSVHIEAPLGSIEVGGVPITGSGTHTVDLPVQPGVVAGSYNNTNISVNQHGIVTSAAHGTAGVDGLWEEYDPIGSLAGEVYLKPINPCTLGIGLKNCLLSGTDLSGLTVGDSNTASGSYAVAMGSGCSAGPGGYSVAMGQSNTASGPGSVAMGQSNTASTPGSVAMGQSNTAGPPPLSNAYSVAMGYSNTASGAGSVAMGQSNTASGDGSVAIGVGPNTASGPGSVAIGSGPNTASGQGSVAMGDHNTASGNYSTAMGGSCVALGEYSVAMGYKAKRDNCAFVVGISNEDPDSGMADGSGNTFFIDNSQNVAMCVGGNPNFDVSRCRPSLNVPVLDISGDLRVRGIIDPLGLGLINVTEAVAIDIFNSMDGSGTSQLLFGNTADTKNQLWHCFPSGTSTTAASIGGGSSTGSRILFFRPAGTSANPGLKYQVSPGTIPADATVKVTLVGGGGGGGYCNTNTSDGGGGGGGAGWAQYYTAAANVNGNYLWIGHGGLGGADGASVAGGDDGGLTLISAQANVGTSQVKVYGGGGGQGGPGAGGTAGAGGGYLGPAAGENPPEADGRILFDRPICIFAANGAAGTSAPSPVASCDESLAPGGAAGTPIALGFSGAGQTPATASIHGGGGAGGNTWVTGREAPQPTGLGGAQGSDGVIILEW